MENVKAAARKQSAETILGALMLIGGAALIPMDQRIARAAMLDVYAEKTSQAEADALMEAMGL